MIDFTKEEKEALLCIINATAVNGSDVKLIYGIINKIEKDKPKKVPKAKKVK